VNEFLRWNSVCVEKEKGYRSSFLLFFIVSYDDESKALLREPVLHLSFCFSEDAIVSTPVELVLLLGCKRIVTLGTCTQRKYLNIRFLSAVCYFYTFKDNLMVESFVLFQNPLDLEFLSNKHNIGYYAYCKIYSANIYVINGMGYHYSLNYASSMSWRHIGHFWEFSNQRFTQSLWNSWWQGRIHSRSIAA
jgi:hypothetical protein